MEDGKSLEDELSDSLLSESEDHKHNAMIEGFLSNKNEKEQTTVAKDTKEHYESFSGDNSRKSSEGWNWRDKNRSNNSFRSSSSPSDRCNWRSPDRNEDKEIVISNNSFGRNFSTPSDRCNWRNPGRNKDKEIAISNYSIRRNSSTSSNWRRSDRDVMQPRPRYGVNSERENLFGMGQRLTGYWQFQCDNLERNPDGLTEADTVWTAVNELLRKEPSVSFLNPEKIPSSEGCTIIKCYTPDYRDEKFILKTANLLRQHVYFPYVMYYALSEYGQYKLVFMHTPNREFYKRNNITWKFQDDE